MEQGNNNRVRNILIAIIIVLITGTIFSIGFYIFSTQSKMARLEKEREQKPNSARSKYDFNKVGKTRS